MPHPTLCVLVSCYGERLTELPAMLLPARADVSYILVHQGDVKDSIIEGAKQALAQRPDVTYVHQSGKGVTRSRNLAISLAIESGCDLVLFSDDDVTFAGDALDKVISAFELYPQADVLTFQIGEQGGNGLLKSYGSMANSHTKLSILKVGTIEIACRARALAEHKVVFPEFMGAGSALPVCDEPVFLARLMDKGAQAFYVPQLIAYHPRVSSGKIYTEDAQFFCRGIAFRLIFGSPKGAAMLLLFWLKNLSKFTQYPKSALLAFFKGFTLATSYDY